MSARGRGLEWEISEGDQEVKTKGITRKSLPLLFRKARHMLIHAFSPCSTCIMHNDTFKSLRGENLLKNVLVSLWSLVNWHSAVGRD